ncbi:MAG: hypothetical protein IPK10_05470 [Bacteroidetes bacterium]|nr:hypothetical protein [Bacteroidota bacterium]
MSNITSFQEAVDEGMINADGEFVDLLLSSHVNTSTNKDPIFNTSPQAPTNFYSTSGLADDGRDAILAALNNFNSFTAVDYAMFLANDQYDPATGVLNTSNTYVLSSLCEGEKNYVWEFIKAIYLQQKAIQYRAKYPSACRAPMVGCSADGYYQNGFTSGGTACANPGLYGMPFHVSYWSRLILIHPVALRVLR